jgi:hypothetical protein
MLGVSDYLPRNIPMFRDVPEKRDPASLPQSRDVLSIAFPSEIQLSMSDHCISFDKTRTKTALRLGDVDPSSESVVAL